MKTLSVQISDAEFDSLKLKSDKISFSDLIDLISRKIVKKNLNDSIKLAKKYGLSKMTLKDINTEVKAVRKKYP